MAEPVAEAPPRAEPEPEAPPKAEASKETDKPTNAEEPKAKPVTKSWSVGNMLSSITTGVSSIFTKTGGGADLTNDTDWYYDEARAKWVQSGKEDEPDAAAPPPPPKVERRRSDGDCSPAASPTTALSPNTRRNLSILTKGCNTVKPGLATAPVNPVATKSPRSHLRNRYVDVMGSAGMLTAAPAKVASTPQPIASQMFVPPTSFQGSAASIMMFQPTASSKPSNNGDEVSAEEN